MKKKRREQITNEGTKREKGNKAERHRHKMQVTRSPTCVWPALRTGSAHPVRSQTDSIAVGSMSESHRRDLDNSVSQSITRIRDSNN
jgi:hypothetical protein